MNVTTPLWLDAITAVFVVVGALAALVGSLGLQRLGSFFQRIHSTTLATTVGVWGLTFATAAQATYVAGKPYVHALLIAIFVALTAPVTTVFLMRAALFRARLRSDPDVPLFREEDDANQPR